MKIPKLKKNAKIEIEFHDIEEDPSWLDEKKVEERPDTDGEGMGYYLKHDKEYLYVCTQKLGKKTIQRNRTTYPIGCIKNIKKLQYET